MPTWARRPHMVGGPVILVKSGTMALQAVTVRSGGGQADPTMPIDELIPSTHNERIERHEEHPGRL